MGKIARSSRWRAASSGTLSSGTLSIAVFALTTALTGCSGMPIVAANPPASNPVTTVVPSATGTPNSVTVFGGYEFVSIQGAGLIATYAINSSSQKPAATYSTPCMDPSGMVATSVNGANVLAAICFDAGALFTLTIAADGSLHALGSLGGLDAPYPGIALDGTNLYVPLFGGSAANGAVAQISLANPASPVLVGTVMLASPSPGQHVNGVSLAAAAGYIYAVSGSESQPLSSSSSIQVISEGSMALVGAPLVVPHAPQQMVIAGSVGYVTLFDELAVEAIDISNPAKIQSIATVSLASCHPIPLAATNSEAYVGCYGEGTVVRLNIANPAQMAAIKTIPGIQAPQDMAISNGLLLVTDASPGGALYTVNLSEL